MADYETVIGLEVHIHLKTATKAFCGCSSEFGNEPNTQVCPVCLGFPGSLPVLNQSAFELAIKVGLALNCTVQEVTKFDRKHYYYPDLPKNFQISQYDLPIAKDGYLDIAVEGHIKRIRIKRAHLEEDAGKLIHQETKSLVDYNRSGIPLLEIVSEPDLSSPEEAYEYLTALKGIVQYVEASDCDMEKGSLRCDANVSIRPKGTTALGTKIELKNMNSFKGVRDALAYEIVRQNELIAGGGAVVQETRLWDARALKTVPMRTKEEAKDYRYFPEPDLPPFTVEKGAIEALSAAIPELPQQKVRRFISDYGLTDYESRIMAADKQDALLSETCLKSSPLQSRKTIVNLLIGPVRAEANTRGKNISQLGLASEGIVALAGYLAKGEISNLSAKAVLVEMIETGKPPREIIDAKNLIQISDTAHLEEFVAQACNENASSVEAYRQGKANALMFLVGQVMKKSAGKANPKVVQEMLKRRLEHA